MEVHEGGCLCGDIRYRVRGKALRALACHCRFCQRRTGSAFAIETFFLQENVEFAGRPAASYQHTSVESGRWLRLDFCPRCGTNLGAEAELRPGQYIVSGGTFDDPDWLDVGMHIWTQSKRRWVVLSEGSERYEKGTQPTRPSEPMPPDATGA